MKSRTSHKIKVTRSENVISRLLFEGKIHLKLIWPMCVCQSIMEKGTFKGIVREGDTGGNAQAFSFSVLLSSHNPEQPEHAT